MITYTNIRHGILSRAINLALVLAQSDLGGLIGSPQLSAKIYSDEHLKQWHLCVLLYMCMFPVYIFSNNPLYIDSCDLRNAWYYKYDNYQLRCTICHKNIIYLFICVLYIGVVVCLWYVESVMRGVGILIVQLMHEVCVCCVCAVRVATLCFN